MPESSAQSSLSRGVATASPWSSMCCSNRVMNVPAMSDFSVHGALV